MQFLRALGLTVAMGWEILWPLILGFALSAVVHTGRRLASADELVSAR
jgi:hypothetical protein